MSNYKYCEELITTLHKKLEKMTGIEVNIAFDEGLEPFAWADNSTGTIIYNPRTSFYVGFEDVVIHEFAHVLQHTYLSYTKHDICFSLIYNLLNYKQYDTHDAIFIRAYDLNDEYLNIGDIVLNIDQYITEVIKLTHIDIDDAVKKAEKLANIYKNNKVENRNDGFFKGLFRLIDRHTQTDSQKKQQRIRAHHPRTCDW